MEDQGQNQQSEAPANLEELMKAIGKNPNYWAEKSPELRAKFTEKIFWQIIEPRDPMLAPEQPAKLEAPSRRWWLETPQVLEVDDPGYLCETCRHVDFTYLIESPVEQIMEEVPLAPLTHVLENKDCSFCRLMSLTINDKVAKDALAVDFQEDTICRLLVFPGDKGKDGPRELSLMDLPCSDGSVRCLRFHRFGPIHDLVAGQPNCGQRQLSPTMDYQLLKSWYTRCLNAKCEVIDPSPNKILPKNFRLIDVQRYCIVKYEPHFDYVALSYDWGNVKPLRITGDPSFGSQKNGALLEMIDQLPRTIEDAITLTGNIGQRYLWIDSLCITHNDPDDVKTQIASMDQIYNGAALTLAIVSGKDANAGISGMSAGPRNFQQHVAYVQGMYLANRPLNFDHAVNDSPWDRRAWTFQERVLSRRMIYVGTERCFYTCSCHKYDFMESSDEIENGMDKMGEILRDKYWTEQRGNLIPSSQIVNVIAYLKIVRMYTARQMSYSSDILNAFKGIEARLRPLFRSDFVPRSELDSQILWKPGGPLKRRLDTATAIQVFPSWSWAGWVGEVRCETSENLSRIEWIEDNGERFSGKDFRYPTGTNQDVIERLDYRLYWRGALDRHLGSPYYFEKGKPENWFFHPTAPEDERITGPNLKRGTNHLVFEAETTDTHNICLGHYTTMAVYGHECKEGNHILCPLPLRDPEGYLGGYIIVPGEIYTEMSESFANGTWSPDYEFVMISRGKPTEQTDRGKGNPDLLVDSEAITIEKVLFPDRPSMDATRGECGFDPQRYDATKPWCVYNIMLVEWKHEVAYRLGIGKMHIDAWAQAKPVKKIVELG